LKIRLKKLFQSLASVALLFGVGLLFAFNAPSVLINLSRIYQRGYRSWNNDYAGLGEKGFLYRSSKGFRFLCREEAYSKELEDTLIHLEKILEERGRLLQEHPHSRKTYYLEIEGISYIVKKSCKLPFLESLFYGSRYTKPAWNNADRMEKMGLKTCHPIALIEFGKALRYTSYLLYPRVGITLEKKKNSIDMWATNLIEIVKKQKKLGILHSDFHCCNVLELDDGSIQYIDIDDLHTYQPYSYIYNVRFYKELNRFVRDFQGNEESLKTRIQSVL
jgi:hypothetical protein